MYFSFWPVISYIFALISSIDLVRLVCDSAIVIYQVLSAIAVIFQYAKAHLNCLCFTIMILMNFSCWHIMGYIFPLNFINSVDQLYLWFIHCSGLNFLCNVF